MQNAHTTLTRHFSELTQKARRRGDEAGGGGGGDDSEGSSMTHQSGTQRLKKMFHRHN